MIELRANDWFTITGYGRVAAMDGIPGLDPRTLRGKNVIIDGELHSVRGVETNAIQDATGRNFGLLVGAPMKVPVVHNVGTCGCITCTYQRGEAKRCLNFHVCFSQMTRCDRCGETQFTAAPVPEHLRIPGWNYD